MSMHNHHIIRSQHLQVELEGTETDGMILQRSLPELCSQWLTPAIERSLDHCCPEHGNLLIERLEIDVGRLNLENLEYELPASVAAAIKNQLGVMRLSAELEENSLSTEIQYKTGLQTTQAVFVYFLETGALPWWFQLQPGQTLEQVILASWQTLDSPGIEAGFASTEILDTLQLASTRSRLIQQFTPTFLVKLLLKLSPALMQVVDEVLQIMKSEKLSAAEQKIFSLYLWQQAFSDLAHQKVQTPFGLAAEVWHRLNENKAEFPALVHLLRQLSSAVEHHYIIRDLDKHASKLHSQSESERKKIEVSRTSSLADFFGKNHFIKDDLPIKNEQISDDMGTDENPSTATNEINDTETKKVHDISINENRDISSKKSLDIAANENHDAGINSKNTKTISTAKNNKSHSKIKSVLHKNTNLQNSKMSGIPNTLYDINNYKLANKYNELHGSPLRSKTNSVEIDGEPGKAKTERSPIRIDVKEGLYVNCAGIILLHPFLPRFLAALGIADEGQLLQPERALCLLHYLATGQTVAPEYELLLPKLLCNVPFEQPVESNVNLTQAELEEAAALLEAVVRHWSALQNTSADSLRGTFLVRPGKLSVRGDGDWLLQVENRTFDILLDQLPWGLGMIKLPWMDKMLWVEWR